MTTIDSFKKTEQIFHGNDEKYRVFFENNCAIILFVNPENGNILFANDAAVIFYGYNKEQLTNMNINKILTLPEEEIKAKRVLSLKNKHNYFELKHKLANGEIRDVELYQTKILYDDKEVFSVIIHDITESKKIEERLKESEERFRNLSNLTFEAILIHKQGVVKDANKAFIDMFGYELETFISKNIIELFVPESSVSLIYEKIKQEYAKPYEVNLRKKDGTIITVEIESKNIMIENEPFRVSALRDISERKKIKNEILKLSKVVEITPDAIIISDLQGNINYVNKELLIIGGYEDNKMIIGKSIYQFTDESGMKLLKEEIIPTILSVGSWKGEISLIKKDGTIFPAEFVSTIILDEENNPKYLLASFRDITERKKTEEELRKHREYLEEIVEERTKDLNEKNKDLEKFNELFVGREFRIKELRNELQRYKDKYGKLNE